MENAPDAENGLTGRDIIALNVLKKFAFIIEKIESFSLKSYLYRMWKGYGSKWRKNLPGM